MNAILFDLDGTLVDTAPDMVGALNAVLADHDRSAIDFSTARPWVSHGSLALVKLGFSHIEDPDRLESLRHEFLQHYAQRLSQSSKPFSGSQQVIEWIKSMSLKWGIVTNKPGWLTDPLLHDLQLQPDHQCVVSGDTTAHRKPHPEPLLLAASLLAVAPETCIYVGDAERDILAGKRANMRTVAVRAGYIPAHENPDAWQADEIIDALHELPQVLQQWC